MEFSSSRQPVLGTVATLQGRAPTSRVARACERAFFASLDRDEGRFSVFEAGSELARWRGGDALEPSRDLVELLGLAQHWMTRSGGVLNPAVGVFSNCWRRAVENQVLPDRGELGEMVATISESRFRVADDGAIERRGSCAELTFHAFAKGFIVDRAATAGYVDRVRSLVANVGGDLLHVGEGEVSVRVENPLRPYDNAEPIATVRLSGQAMATSGGSRRGYVIDGAWFSHVIDPRTGWPVTAVSSASVVAETCVRADAIATVLSVLDPSEGMAFAADEGVAALVLDAAGATFANDAWRAIER